MTTHSLLFEERVSTAAWSLTDTQETILRVLIPSPSYGAKIAESISESSDFNVLLDLGYVYRMLKELLAKQLVEVDSLQPGGRERNGHRQKHYRITPLGIAAVERKDAYRLSLSKRIIGTDSDEEVAVT